MMTHLTPADGSTHILLTALRKRWLNGCPAFRMESAPMTSDRKWRFCAVLVLTGTLR